MRRMLAGMATVVCLAACGSQGGTGPGNVVKPGATPVPGVEGPLLRMRAAAFGSPLTRVIPSRPACRWKCR